MTEDELREVNALMARRSRAMMLKDRGAQAAMEAELVNYKIYVKHPVDWSKPAPEPA